MNQQRNSVPCLKDAKWWGCFGYPEAVFLGLLDPHPDRLVSTGLDPVPDPAIIKQKKIVKKL
jgi:hypothetical protein